MIINFCPLLILGQQENTIWQLGSGFELTFTPNPSIQVNNNIGSILNSGQPFGVVSSSAISDEKGNLLFYSDGMSVYNRIHQIMPNGNDLTGDPFTNQTVSIAKSPLHSNHYFVFTRGASSESFFNPFDDHLTTLAYSIVDMSLQNGLGDIVEESKNTILSINNGSTLAATQGLCDEIWIIVHNSSTRIFESYKIDFDGVQTAITSETGSISGSTSFSSIKVTPNGRKLLHISVATSINDTSFAEILDFNSITGSINHIKTLVSGVDSIGQLSGSFSQSSDMLYLYIIDKAESQGKIHHFNLANSQDFNPVQTFNPSSSIINDLQRGPNDDIVIQAFNYLGIIQDASMVTSLFVDSIADYPKALQFSGNLQNPPAIPHSSVQLRNMAHTPNDTFFCIDEFLALSIHDTSLEELTYNWSTGSSDSSILIDEMGEYTVTISNEYCSFIDTIQVDEEILCDCIISTPNIFYPNSTMGNDRFYLQTNCPLEHFELLIFSQNGEMMFKSNGIDISWDGTVQNQLAIMGVYVYTLNYQFQGGSRMSIAGDITLIR